MEDGLHDVVVAEKDDQKWSAVVGGEKAQGIRDGLKIFEIHQLRTIKQ